MKKFKCSVCGRFSLYPCFCGREHLCKRCSKKLEPIVSSTRNLVSIFKSLS